MSRPTYAPPQPTLRGEIEQALRGGRGGFRISATIKYLARHVGAPITAVQRELEMMALEGIATSRRLKSGETLYKLIDKHHFQWAALAGPGTRPTRVTA